jgi:uncharacterized metal-binding protein YceD (DUF177 family)
MTHDQLIIYTEQLRDGHKESIHLDLDPSFLDVHEKELSFNTPVHIEGEAYATETHLLFHLTVLAQAQLNCSVCNSPFSFAIKIEKLYHTIPLNELKSAVFDYSALIREEILLQIPPYAECSNGQCPERASLSSFLKNEETKENPPTHFPFSNL